MAGAGCNAGRVGREVELKAWLWLIRHGYEVFDNVFPNGPIDIVAISLKDGAVLKLEVRKASIQRGGVYFNRLTSRQVELGVQILLYRPDLDDFEFVAADRAAPAHRHVSWPPAERAAALKAARLA